MKGVVFEQVGANPKLVHDLEVPSPGPGQVLVKPIWMAINPVDAFMSKFGLLVVDWPLGLGCDSAGVVTDSGNEATEKYGLKAGDAVFGCTRLGVKGYAAAQEFHLFDAQVVFPKPDKITFQEAATLGVASLTAALGLFNGLHIPVPDPKNLPKAQDQWLIVLGGASSVGKVAIQLAQAAGYNVIASSSPGSAEIISSLGAVPFNYKDSPEQQVKEVLKVTSGNFSRLYDAVANDDLTVVTRLFEASTFPDKYFTTTNDWNPTIKDFSGAKTDMIALGAIGRPEAEELNAKLEQYIPCIIGLIESGKLTPSEYQAIGDGGFEDAIAAYHHQTSGAGGSRKVLVKLHDP
ncbi:hypothetical protein PV10_05422 [Exophiala mesophila]|uniref:Enoyl reductase (ER) domain-containing protein n=1 Tax=Exophiala mesophila TaxID=212818 RepID=A0A0D1WP25_EXOME|nr:uncharacterized protein PV10_05422 [Exophiala mesophila]KIV90815.1 hypothetical protein PV10_05422 [Exophiala mesophila]